MWAAIFGVLAATPKIIELLEAVVKWLSVQIDEAKKRKLHDEMIQATDKAKRDKDTSDLDAIFDSDKKRKSK